MMMQETDTPARSRFEWIAIRLWPELATFSAERRIIGAGDVLTTLYAAPLAFLGVVWLARVSEFSLALDQGPIWLLHAALFVLFDRLNFFLIVELRQNRYGSADGSLASVILWSALFLMGPAALWIAISWSLVLFLYRWRTAYSKAARWGRVRNQALEIAAYSVAYLGGFSFFEATGGQIPVSGLHLEVYLPAIGAMAVAFLLQLAVWSGYIAYAIWTQQVITVSRSLKPIFRFILLSLGLPALAQPFGIVTAGLFAEKGIFIYLLLVAGLFIVAILTRQLSWVAETSRLQSRLLQKLEQLSREILTAFPDEAHLSRLLHEHLPNTFPPGNLVIWYFPDRVVYMSPADWQPPIEQITAFLQELRKPGSMLGNEPVPWLDGVRGRNPAIYTPILDAETGQPLGGIYLELRPLAQPWYRRNMAELFPAIQALADQIASAIQQHDMYEQLLDYQRVSQELKLAGEIQASFLPFNIPRIPGWQVALTLFPAGEISGDFFDVIQFDEDRLGIVIADVADHGVGPALFMALSRTLIRTYALEFDAQPDIVFFATNERILRDSNAQLFVTAFYGVLNLKDGTLNYCNAGQSPPYLIKPHQEKRIIKLSRTGVPIGIEQNMTWSQARVQLEPGDVLVLYTDGIPDAQNADGQFFGEKALAETILDHLDGSAEEIQQAILDGVSEFVGDAPQFDDITLLVLMRGE